jgi:excisionase family DNA binding protein
MDQLVESSNHPTAVEVPVNEVITDRWLSVDEIAAYLGIRRFTIYKWIDRKQMPTHKVGSLWKFRKEEVDEWVRSGKAAEPNENRKSR